MTTAAVQQVAMTRTTTIATAVRPSGGRVRSTETAARTNVAVPVAGRPVSSSTSWEPKYGRDGPMGRPVRSFFTKPRNVSAIRVPNSPVPLAVTGVVGHGVGKAAMGWICVASGTPGMWEPLGTIGQDSLAPSPPSAGSGWWHGPRLRGHVFCKGDDGGDWRLARQEGRPPLPLSNPQDKG